MKDPVATAWKYIQNGYNVIPCSDNKLPSIGNWSRFQTKPMTFEECEKYFSDAKNIALLCGGATRVVALDADMKYDLSKDLWERFKKAVPNDILKKVMCQSTQNGGYHLVFRVPSSRLVGNEKLASRYTTAYEKHITYMEAFENAEMRDKALKIALSDSSRILFETRSGSATHAGGYILIAPSKGYKRIYGKIQELDENEYDALMSVARSFNEVKVTETFKDSDYHTKWSKSPFDHFNEEGDIVQLLTDHGWTIVPRAKTNNIRFLRPGKTHSENSAMLDEKTRIFNVFSTSTVFDVSKGYNASGVFIMLECEGDSSLAYKKLVSIGFGIK